MQRVQILSDERRDRVAARQDSLHFAWQYLGDLQHHVVGQHVANAFVLLAGDLVAPHVDGLQGVQLAIVERALRLGVHVQVRVGGHFGLDVALAKWKENIHWVTINGLVSNVRLCKPICI